MSDNDNSGWYEKIYNVKEAKKLDTLDKAIDSLLGFLKKQEDGDYEIEEKPGVTQTHEKSGLSQGMAGMEATIEQVVNELLEKDLTPEARAKVEQLRALLNEYKHAEDVFDTQKEVNQMKQKLTDQMERALDDIREMSEDLSLYNIEIKKEGVTGITLDDIFPEAAARAEKKIKKKKNEFDFEAPMDDGGGEWDAAPKGKKKRTAKKAVKATPQRKRASKAKTKALKAPTIKKVKGMKVKQIKLPTTEATKPISKMTSEERAIELKRELAEAKELEKQMKEIADRYRKTIKRINKLKQ